MALCFLMSLQNKSYSVKLQDLKKIMWQIIILSIWPEGFLQSIVCDSISGSHKICEVGSPSITSILQVRKAQKGHPLRKFSQQVQN